MVLSRSLTKQKQDFRLPLDIQYLEDIPQALRSLSVLATSPGSMDLSVDSILSTTYAAYRIPGSGSSLLLKRTFSPLVGALTIRLMSMSSSPRWVLIIQGRKFFLGSSSSSFFITLSLNPNARTYHCNETSGLLTRVPMWSIPPLGAFDNPLDVTTAPSSPPSFRSNSKTVPSGSLTKTATRPLPGISRVPLRGMFCSLKYAFTPGTDPTPKLMCVWPGNFSSGKSMRILFWIGAFERLDWNK
mmetsp:Transcript_18029/g.32693  ORF Transcript_18029/g.32693 Transcript_18029/m.32693 type:complete len:243 (-) Transcript_18029:297-1025(-)